MTKREKEKQKLLITIFRYFLVQIKANIKARRNEKSNYILIKCHISKTGILQGKQKSKKHMINSLEYAEGFSWGLLIDFHEVADG